MSKLEDLRGYVTKFRWTYRGRTEDGNTIKFEGHGWAEDSHKAADQIETMMRAKYPDIKWMHGREIEGGNVTFGPTIQMLKEKRKLDVAIHRPSQPVKED